MYHIVIRVSRPTDTTTFRIHNCHISNKDQKHLGSQKKNLQHASTRCIVFKCIHLQPQIHIVYVQYDIVLTEALKHQNKS